MHSVVAEESRLLLAERTDIEIARDVPRCEERWIHVASDHQIAIVTKGDPTLVEEMVDMGSK